MIYIDCEHCDGEYPMDVEETDDGGAGIYGATTYYLCWLDVATNRTSHRDDCPGRQPTEARVAELEEEADRMANDPAYGYRESRAEAWAEVGL